MNNNNNRTCKSNPLSKKIQLLAKDTAFCLLASSALVFGNNAVLAEQIQLLTDLNNHPEPVVYISQDELIKDAQAPASGANEPDYASWPMGKIEPVVVQEAQNNETIQIIVYLKTTSATQSQSDDPLVVKARHQPQIKALSNQIKGILKNYQSAISLDEAGEKSFQDNQRISTFDKLELDKLRKELDKKLDAMRASIGVAAAARVAKGQTELSDFIVAAGGTINAKIPLTNAIGATIPSALLDNLALHPLTGLIVKDQPVELELNVSKLAVGSTTWHTGGFNGGIWDGGVVDTGVQQDHPGFAGINFFTDSATPTDTDGHGTHVAGIISGRSLTYTGMAPGLDALIWGRSGAQATTMSRMHTMASAHAQAPESINHSLGYGTATVDYNTNDRFYDAFIQNFDIMVAKSAGNNGWGASPTITHPAPAYNLMAVANMNDQNTTGTSDDVRSTSSSIGPTISGRKKPDISAPGSAIISTNAFWPTTGTGTQELCRNSSNHNDYVTCSGTSMAAPHVAGAIVLLEDGGNHTPMAQKAVLINTADAWNSNGTSTTTDDGPFSGSLWDKSYGWGYLDLLEAHFNRADYFTDSVIPRNSNNVEDDYKLYAGQMFTNEKATLVWEKRGIYVNGAPPTTTYSLSDIDMHLFNEADDSIVDSDIDVNDNVHQVASNASIDTVIKVSAFSSSFSGATSEPFALATEENFISVDFPETFVTIKVAGPTPSQMEPGEIGSFELFVRNNSTLASHANLLDLVLPAGWTLISGADPVGIGSIAGSGSDSTHAIWQLQAPVTEGSYSINFAHQHNSYLESFGPRNSFFTVNVADTTPPTPNPMTFSTLPFELNNSQISMVASTASDALHNPVEYQFDFTSGGTGGTDSAWQSSRTYTDFGLAVNTQYCYRVHARDNAIAKNATAYSPISCDYTAANLPGAAGFSNITQTSIQANWTANGNPSATRYFIENSTGGTNSGWITSTLWNNTGLICGTTYTYRVKARNGDGVETAWRSLGSQATSPCASMCNGDFDGDGDVDGTDLGSFNTDFGRTDCSGASPCNGDFDNDGDVDGTDLGLFNSDFGRTDCPVT